MILYWMNTEKMLILSLQPYLKSKIDTFADLVSHQRGELMKFRNFGKKSMNEIEVLIEKVKLNFGMDVTKYGIEPKQSVPEQDAAADNEKETETTETEIENYEA